MKILEDRGLAVFVRSVSSISVWHGVITQDPNDVLN